jgi:predicted MFS family arabinose efflux permease
VTVTLFTLGNSSDTFLLLRLSQSGISAPGVAVSWSVFHVVKMLATYWGGGLSDRFSHPRLLLAGWTVYALAYAAFAWFEEPVALMATFFGYALYFGLTEPAERAWVAQLAPPSLRATAFGYFHGAKGLAALPASLAFGALWEMLGAKAAFGAGAFVAVAASILLAVLLPPRDTNH